MQHVMTKKKKEINDSSISWEEIFEKKAKMSIEEQEEYRNQNWDKIQDKIKEVDAKWAFENISLTEDEIADMVSKDRRESYEATHRY